MLIAIFRICSVHWADLAVIDLEKAKTPEGRAEQVRIARDAMHNDGFFYVVNHGLEQTKVSYGSRNSCTRIVHSEIRTTACLTLDLLLLTVSPRKKSFATRYASVVASRTRRKAYFPLKARIKETGTYLGYKLPQYWVGVLPLRSQ